MAEVKSPGTKKELWVWVAAIGLAAFVLGFFGYSAMADRHNAELSMKAVQRSEQKISQAPERPPNAAPVEIADENVINKDEDVINKRDVVYGALGLFVFNEPPWTEVDWRLDVARFLAPVATGIAGITAVYTLFNEQIWAIRLRRWKDHVVVCGLGYKGFTFVQRLHRAGRSVVVIESDPANATIDDCRELGIPVIVGDAQHDQILRRAGVQRAEWLLSMCPDDAINTEILLSASAIAEERNGSTLHCLAQISNPQLCSLLRISQINQTNQIDRDEPTWTANFFNTDDTSAALMVERYGLDAVADKPPHILIAHLDPLGQRLVVLAAQRWVTQRERTARTRAMRLVITVVDDDADTRIRALKREYAVLRDTCTFITSSVSAADIADLRAEYTVSAAPKPLRAFVTASDDDRGVATTLLLLHHLNLPIDIAVAQSREYGTGKLLDSLRSVKVEVFPTFEMTCTSDLLFKVSIKRLAKEIHEIWREEQLAVVDRIDGAVARLRALGDGGDVAATVIGEAFGELEDARSDDGEVLATIKTALDKLESARAGDARPVTIEHVVAELRRERKNYEDPPKWEYAKESDRISSMEQAHDIPAKLRSINCPIVSATDGEDADFELTDEEVELLAVQEHDRWMSERRNAGWTDGPKDNEAKTSPYLVPFAALPPHIAEWDRVFVRKIPSILRKASYRVVRNPQSTTSAT